MALKIFEATFPAQEKAFLDVWLALLGEGYDRHNRGPVPFAIRDSVERRLLPGIIEKNGIVILAEDSNVVIGVAVVYPMFSTYLLKDYLYVEDLWVAPNFRRKGVANDVMGFIEGLCDGKRFAKRVALDTTEHNEAATNLYLGRGYEITGPKMRKEW